MDITMPTKQTNSASKKGSRIAVLLASISFGVYVLNVLAGKANIVYGWELFHLGNIGEFLTLLFSSTAFIAAALYQEAAWKSNPETNS
jgi:hypothetical protein